MVKKIHQSRNVYYNIYLTSPKPGDGQSNAAELPLDLAELQQPVNGLGIWL
jgi:hypothetical protein